jgi:hypothetical protein
MVAPLTIGAGWTVGPGWDIGPSPTLMLSLDATSYANVTTVGSQNINGSPGATGGFFRPNDPTYAQIVPGWTVVGHPDWIVTAASCNPGDQYTTDVTITGGIFLSGQSYAFTSSNTWIDSVGNLPFVLNGGVTYNSGNGGYLTFDPASSQYAESASIASITTWSVEIWHYFADNNVGSNPCILTEVFTGGGINYTLGAINNNTNDLEAGWFNGGSWIYTGTSYNLAPGTWNQIVGTYDGNFPKLYVNNTLVETGITSGGSAFGSGAGIRLMRRWDDANYWGGNLAIVKIYEGALSQTGVTTSWNANKARFGL